MRQSRAAEQGSVQQGSRVVYTLHCFVCAIKVKPFPFMLFDNKMWNKMGSKVFLWSHSRSFQDDLAVNAAIRIIMKSSLK
eukprot:1626877-Ditylum_brightwellii.AAC.1